MMNKKLKMIRVRPFVYEKNNNTKLIVVSECDFEELAQELSTNPQLLELSIQNIVCVSLDNHFIVSDTVKLPKLRKFWANEEGSRLPQCSSWIIRTFALSLCVIDCYSVIIPEGLHFPRLRYLKLVETDPNYSFGENPRLSYPKLTYLYIPNFSMNFPSVDLGPPIVIYGNKSKTELCSNILRNQKREHAALTLYLCVKIRYKCRDVAKMLMNLVMCTSNVFWKLTKNDVIQQDNDDKIYFARFTDTLVELEKYNKTMIFCTKIKPSLDRRASESKNSLNWQRGKKRNDTELKYAKDGIEKIVKNIKKRKTNFIDE